MPKEVLTQAQIKDFIKLADERGKSTESYQVHSDELRKDQPADNKSKSEPTEQK
jgi:hypothetical protein